MKEIFDTVLTADFLYAFIIAALIALAVGALIFVICAYFVKLKKLEKQIEEFKAALDSRLDTFEENTRQDFARERHMINESLAGISETVMRAVISVSGKKQD